MRISDWSSDVCSSDLEGVAALADLTLHVAGLPGDPDVPLVAVVVGLEVLVADRPVLDRRSLWQRVLAVALDVVAPVLEVARVEAPRLGRPVHPGAAVPVARGEGAVHAPIGRASGRERGCQNV